MDTIPAWVWTLFGLFLVALGAGFACFCRWLGEVADPPRDEHAEWKGIGGAG